MPLATCSVGYAGSSAMVTSVSSATRAGRRRGCRPGRRGRSRRCPRSRRRSTGPGSSGSQATPAAARTAASTSSDQRPAHPAAAAAAPAGRSGAPRGRRAAASSPGTGSSSPVSPPRGRGTGSSPRVRRARSAAAPTTHGRLDAAAGLLDGRVVGSTTSATTQVTLSELPASREARTSSTAALSTDPLPSMSASRSSSSTPRRRRCTAASGRRARARRRTGRARCSCTPSTARRIRLRCGCVRDSSSVIRPSSIRLCTNVWSLVSCESCRRAAGSRGCRRRARPRSGSPSKSAAVTVVPVPSTRGPPRPSPRAGRGPGASPRRAPRACRRPGGAVEPPQQRAPRCGGDVAAGRAADAVRDHQQVLAGVAGVLVVLAEPADVGHGGVAQRRRHRGSVVAWSILLQLERGLADPDLDAELERGRLGDPLGADVGAVGGAEVLDVPLVAGAGDAGVPGGDVVVVEPDRGVGAPADQDRARRRAGRHADVARPRRPRRGSGRRAALGRLGGPAWRRASPRSRSAPRALGSTRAPNMSERITETAESTKIHRIAR